MRKSMGAIAMCCLLLAACTKPLPPEKAAYAGDWRSRSMSLLITAGGNVMYRRMEGDVSKSVNGPLKSFEGDNFVVGVGPMETTFVVSVPPHQDGGQWKMVVDGVELVKAPPNE